MPEPDYDKLAAQHGGKPVDYDAIAADVSAGAGPASAPYKMARAEDFMPPEASFLDIAASGVKAVVEGLNPLPMLKALYDDTQGAMKKSSEALKRGDVGGALTEGIKASPLGTAGTLAMGIGKAQLAQFEKAKQAYDAGRYSEALGYTAAGVTPLVGPMAATAGERIGTGDPNQMASGVGLAASVFVPGAVGKVLPKSVKVPGTGKFANTNPAEVAAVQYGERVGIPIDAATATGNDVIRGAQGVADVSLGGAIPGYRARQAQTAALRREAGALEARAFPSAVTPETAGRAIGQDVRGYIKERGRQADVGYGKLRDIEADTAIPVQTGVTRTTREFPSDIEFNPHEDFLKAIARNGGIGLDKGMPGEIRQLWESRSRGASTLNRMRTAGAAQESVDFGNAVGGVGGVIKRTGGKTLDEIAEAMREDGYNVEGPRDLLDQLEAARVGQMRPPTKPGGVDVIEEPVIETIGMPLDLTDVRESTRPILERLERDKDLGLTRDERSTLQALRTIHDGPAIRPASEVDRVLGKLKGIARFEGPSQLRGAGKGSAAAAVSQLEAQVAQAVADVGGAEATAARNLGRQATAQKYEAGKILKQLRKEPVEAFRQVTAAGDAHIDYARELQKLAPSSLPQIGRAWLSETFNRSRSKGGFGKAQGNKVKWDALGDETKKLMFPDAEHRADVGHFMLLADRIAENPNPSRTSLVSWATPQGLVVILNPLTGIPYTLGSAAITKLLHSKAGVRVLTQAMEIPTGATKAERAARYSRVVSLAGARPTGGLVPAAARDESEQR